MISQYHSYLITNGKKCAERLQRLAQKQRGNIFLAIHRLSQSLTFDRIIPGPQLVTRKPRHLPKLHPKYLRRELNHGHCFNHNFFMGIALVLITFFDYGPEFSVKTNSKSLLSYVFINRLRTDPPTKKKICKCFDSSQLARLRFSLTSL